MAARSPNYPGVDLEFAVERAERVWNAQQGHAAADQVVMANLGYAKISGAGSVTFGALKRFGLLEAGDKGRSRLSALGVSIVRGESTGQRDYQKLRDAALLPKVHKDIWEAYGTELPADSVITFDLQQKGFTQKGAKEFLAQWKRTMAFAKLAEAPATVPPHASDSGSEQLDEAAETPGMTPETAQKPTPSPVVSIRESREYAFPLVDGDQATFILPARMSEESWDQMLVVLEAFKPGIVRPVNDDE